MRTRYNIPKRIAEAWVANGKVLPLLDGLDEVQTAYRMECAQAINEFQQEHLVPLVVCSRTLEYTSLTLRLRLHGAVLLQPLSDLQIDAYLERAGPRLNAVRRTLQEDIELQSLAKSPLLLSIITLAYDDVDPDSIALSDNASIDRRQLFNTYLQRMFVRREIMPIYSGDKTMRWLQWLAITLVNAGQTVFAIERMQPNWLGPPEQKSARSVLLVSLGGLFCCMALGEMFALLTWLIVTLIDVLRWFALERSLPTMKDILLNLAGIMFICLIVGLIIGAFAVLRDLVTGAFRKINIVEQSEILKQRLTDSLINSTVVTLLFGFLFSRELDWKLSTLWALVFGIIAGLYSGFIVPVPTTVHRQKPNRGIKLSIYQALMVTLVFWLVTGIAVGVAGGIVSNILYGNLLTWNEYKQDELIRYMAVGGEIGGLIGGLMSGGDAITKHLLLRFFLFMQGRAPWNYAGFLDYATSLIFLRKVGDGYIFVHRLILEHFASLDEEEIRQIVASVHGHTYER